MKINTIVVYSSEIIDSINHLNCGSIKYDVKSFYMSSFDGDAKLKVIQFKVENNLELTM